MALAANARYIMYLTGYECLQASQLQSTNALSRQHNDVPEPNLVSEVTHVAIAFMPSSGFNEENPSAWPLFTTVEEVRSKFAKGTSIMVAIGGWGDSGFPIAARTDYNRKLFAKNVKAMVEYTGADGSLSKHGPLLRLLTFCRRRY